MSLRFLLTPIAQQTMAPTLFFLLFSFLFLNESFGDETEVIISTNATTVEAEQSFILRCELKNYVLGNEEYIVYFYQNGSDFCFYRITISSEQQTATFENESSYHPSLGRQPLSSTFPVYEIMVTPTIASTDVYYCHVYRSRSVDVDSKHMSIIVTPPFPRAVLTSNVSSIVAKQPFTVSCTFTHFTSPPVNYQVTFSSFRDGQVAVIEVANGTELLRNNINDKVDVVPGTRSTFPNFDLVLTEKVDISTEYWCSLEETGKAPVQSDPWPVVAHFSASKTGDNQRVGTCVVPVGLNGKAFSVQFYSDLGPKSVNLLAEYVFRPNLLEQFKTNLLSPWSAISHGPNITLPVFSIQVTGTSLHGHWWCSLALGTLGSPDYREYKSNSVDL